MNSKKTIVTALAALSASSGAMAAFSPVAHAATQPASLWMSSQTPESWMNQNDTIGWATRSATIPSSLVGQKVTLTFASGAGSSIDCSVIGAGYSGTSGWVNVTGTKACSTTAASLTFTVTSGMVGNTVQLSGASAPTAGSQTKFTGTGTYVANGVITNLSSYATLAASVSVKAPSVWMGWAQPESWMNQNDFIRWQVASSPITSDQVGSTYTLSYSSGAGSSIDTSNIGVGYGGANGWVNVTPTSKSATSSSASYSFKVTSDMVGKAVQLSGTSAPTNTTQSSYTGIGKASIGASSATTNGSTARGEGTITDTPTTTPTNPTTDPTPTSVNSATTPNTGAPSNTALKTSELPRIAWEGGNSYYSKFPGTAAAGWTNPNFFPVAIWWAQYSNDAEVKWDKSLGVNTYIFGNKNMDYKLLENNGVSWIGPQLPNMPRDSKAWAGDYLDDEIDGRYSATAGITYIQSLADALPDHNKVRYANYTGMVISWLNNNPEWSDAAYKYTNNYTDIESLDAYWFSGSACDWTDPHGSEWLTTFTKANCRTGQNYGRNVASLRKQDAKDGKLQPIYNFVENVDVTDNGTHVHTLTPAEVKGAAVSSLINEARGLVWFNNSFGGPDASGNAIRTAQYQGAAYPGYDTVMAMGQVNNQIKSLAPVLNTQSYAWKASDKADTMLKMYNGSGYLFAMPNDANYTANSNITMSLPSDLRGRKIEVVDENRTITPNADGTFTDNFKEVNSYHIYKIV